MSPKSSSRGMMVASSYRFFSIQNTIVLIFTYDFFFSIYFHFIGFIFCRTFYTVLLSYFYFSFNYIFCDIMRKLIREKWFVGFDRLLVYVFFYLLLLYQDMLKNLRYCVLCGFFFFFNIMIVFAGFDFELGWN